VVHQFGASADIPDLHFYKEGGRDENRMGTRDVLDMRMETGQIFGYGYWYFFRDGYRYYPNINLLDTESLISGTRKFRVGYGTMRSGTRSCCVMTL
jgi:hypothetical protein